MTSQQFKGALAPVIPRVGRPAWRLRGARYLLAALVALASLSSAWSLCTPAGGFPGSPRAGASVGGLLGGLGMLGPASRVEAALAGLATGGQAGAAPACGGATAAPAQAEPASLPAAAPDRSAGNPFDVVTGRKHEQRIDLVLPAVDSVTAIDAQGRASGALERVAGDESLLFQFSRFYSSGNDFSLTLGSGWSHSFDTRLARKRLATAPGPGLPAAELQLLQADGRRIVMRPVAALASGRIRYQAADLSDGVVEEDPQAGIHPWIWRWPSGRRLAFDTRGRLASVEAPDQDRLKLRYDAQGLLVGIDDRHGRTVRLLYQAGRLAELVLPDGQSIRYAYDAARQLIGVRYPDGRLVQHHYEEEGQPGWLTGTTEPDGRRSRFRYHADGRVASSLADTNDPASEVRARYQQEDAAGHAGETHLEYQGGITRYRWRIDAASTPWITGASGPGCPQCPTVGQSTGRDARGRLIALGDWRLGYDALGRVSSLARGAGASDPVWRLTYSDGDPLARPSVIDAPSVVPAARRRIELSHNPRGQLVRLIERGWAPYSDDVRPVARGLQVIHAEAGALAGKRIAIEQLDIAPGPGRGPGGDRVAGASQAAPATLARTEFRFDAWRRLEAVFHPESIVRQVERDALGRPIRETLPDGVSIVRQFAPGWQLARLERGANSWQWHRRRDGQLDAIAPDSGRPMPIDLPAIERFASAYSQQNTGPSKTSGSPAVEHHQAEAALPGVIPQGLIAVETSLVQIDADGRRTETVFDDLGRIIEERSAQRGLRQVFYDSLGHPVTTVLPAGGLERRRFDAAGRLLEREQRAAGESVTTRYHWTGLRLSGLDHPEHAVRATHDPAGRLIRLEHRLGLRAFHYDFKYDDASRLSERSLGDDFRLRYEYDAEGRATRLGLLMPGRAEPVWLVDNVVYAAHGAVSERLGAGVQLARRFDAEGRLIALDWQRGRGSESLARYELRLRSDGLLDSIGRRDGEERFGFDAAGRLIVREWQRAHGATQRSFYHYSPGGDLALMRDEAGRSERVRPDEVDAAGRPLRHGGWALRYGPSGRIERLERLEPRGVGARPSSELPREARGRSASAGGVPPARSVDLRFNALGERVLRRIHREGSAPEESRFLYHQNALVAEVGGEGRITRHFIRWQGRVIAIVEPPRASAGPASRTARLPNIVWLLGDHLGTPQLAVDSAGRPVWQARLGVYGEVLESHGTFDQPLRFAGHYHDRDTGLHDNYQRTYDPRHGRYLEPDPLGLAAGWNLHAYAAGNPVQATDPLGLILFAFDGTGNSDPARSPDTLSNVAKFVSLYAGSDRHYMSGVGTFDRGSGIGADAFDTLQATSARRRVDHMLGVLDTALRAPETRGEPVNVDVIGFSRGAAMARDFANTVAARINSGHYLATGRCVSLNFVGLWDTVAQFGLNGQANAQWNLGIPAQARVVVHAVALNEHRRFFPLESIGRAASAPPGGWRLERGFIGDHGDIGGSHAQGDLSDVALGWMVDQARKAGVGLKALDAAWQTVTDPLLHDSRTLLAPGPDRDIRRSPSVAGSASALGSGLDRNRAESMIRRYPYMLRGHDGAATLAGRVDMAAYSTWLSEHYGLDVLY